MFFLKKEIEKFDGYNGIIIKDFNSGKVIYEYNRAKKFIPASVTKLYTTFLVLEIFGIDYEIKIPLYINKSKPLHEIIEYMMKVSDNEIAETLFRLSGVKKYGKGSTENAISALSYYMYKYFDLLIENDYIITDGAGISRYNLVSPEITVKLLEYMYNKYNKKFLNILANPYTYGTLEGRFNFNVWAKTGTLSGVSSLAGFLETKNNNFIVFSLFENNYVYEKGYGKSFEDRVINYIYKNF